MTIRNIVIIPVRELSLSYIRQNLTSTDVRFCYNYNVKTVPALKGLSSLIGRDFIVCVDSEEKMT